MSFVRIGAFSNFTIDWKNGMLIRTANKNEIETLIEFRLAYLEEDTGGLTVGQRTSLRGQLQTYFEKHLGEDMTAYFAEVDGKPVSTIFLVRLEKPANVHFMNGKYVYEFKADKNFVLSTTVSVLTIGLSLLLIWLAPAETNYWGRILGQAVVYGVVGLIIYASIIKSGKTFYNKEYWKFTLPIALPTVFHSLANIVLHQSDKIMLQNLISNSAVGIYALACTFSGVLNTIWSALNNSWVPFYYEYTRVNQIDEMKKHARNYTELFTILSMGFVLLAREVFHLYAAESFWGGTDYIPLFALGYYFVFLYSFPVNYEFYYKKTKTVAVGTTCAAVCNIVLNYLFIKLWGVVGAVIATATAYSLQFTFHFIRAKQINPGEFPFKLREFIPGLVAMAGTCLFYWFTRELWLVRWGVGCVLGVYLLLKIIKRKEIF